MSNDGFDPEAIEAARKTFAGPVAFLKSAPALQHLPDAEVPEVAVVKKVAKEHDDRQLVCQRRPIDVGEQEV